MMTFRQCWFLIYTCLVLCLAACGAFAFTTARQGNRLLVDGKPTALTFARNCTDPDDLPAYQNHGFNTLLVSIDSPGPRKLEEAEALIAAAEALGLYLLIELQNGAWSSEQYADPHSAEYQENCGYFLDAIIARFATHPNLLGWVISTVDEEKFISDPGTLRNFLEVRYGGLNEMLNAWSDKDGEGRAKNRPRVASWNHFSNLSQQQLLSLAKSKTVAARIREDLKGYQDLLHLRDAGFRMFLQKNYPMNAGEFISSTLVSSWNSGGKEWGIKKWDDITVDLVTLHEKNFPGSSPASLLDLARYKASVSPMLLDWWAQEITRRDPDHRLFAGAQHTYRTLITLPHSLDGVLTECHPGSVEPDLRSQNPHAVDIARRGNQFIVLAGILARGVRPPDLANAVYAAAVHGAAGICVSDWPALSAAPAAGDPYSCAEAIRYSLQDMAQRELLGRTPAPTVALVYSPYVGGLHIGKRRIYGYMDNASFLSGPGTPGSLFFQLREGTSFGQFDYLSGDDLDRVPLSRYRAILMPSALEIPVASQKKLFYYVRDGGTVVADLGAGTVVTDKGLLSPQATNDLYTLPGLLMLLFHVRTMPGIDTVRLNLEMDQPNARFPHVLPGMRTNGLSAGYMVTRMAKVTPLDGTQYLFTAVTNTGYKNPVPRRPRPMPLRPTRGMFSYRLGKGTAVYAPFPLYQYWLPENHLFGEFHRDLFGMHASVFLQRPIDFIPLLAEVAAYADGSVVAWTKDQSRPEVVVQNPARRLYSVPDKAGRCTLTPDSTLLRYTLPGLQITEPLPVMVHPTPLTVHASTQENSRQALAFTLSAEGADAQHPVVLTIGSGRYALEPGASCRVTLNGRTTQVMADARGMLALTLTAAHTRVRIGEAESSGSGNEVIFDIHSLDEEPVLEATPLDYAPAEE